MSVFSPYCAGIMCNLSLLEVKPGISTRFCTFIMSPNMSNNCWAKGAVLNIPRWQRSCICSSRATKSDAGWEAPTMKSQIRVAFFFYNSGHGMIGLYIFHSRFLEGLCDSSSNGATSLSPDPPKSHLRLPPKTFVKVSNTHWISAAAINKQTTFGYTHSSVRLWRWRVLISIWDDRDDRGRLRNPLGTRFSISKFLNLNYNPNHSAILSLSPTGLELNTFKTVLRLESPPTQSCHNCLQFHVPQILPPPSLFLLLASAAGMSQCFCVWSFFRSQVLWIFWREGKGGGGGGGGGSSASARFRSKLFPASVCVCLRVCVMVKRRELQGEREEERCYITHIWKKRVRQQREITV